MLKKKTFFTSHFFFGWKLHTEVSSSHLWVFRERERKRVDVLRASINSHLLSISALHYCLWCVARCINSSVRIESALDIFIFSRTTHNNNHLQLHRTRGGSENGRERRNICYEFAMLLFSIHSMSKAVRAASFFTLFSLCHNKDFVCASDGERTVNPRQQRIKLTKIEVGIFFNIFPPCTKV